MYHFQTKKNNKFYLNIFVKVQYNSRVIWFFNGGKTDNFIQMISPKRIIGFYLNLILYY